MKVLSFSSNVYYSCVHYQYKKQRKCTTTNFIENLGNYAINYASYQLWFCLRLSTIHSGYLEQLDIIVAWSCFMSFVGLYSKDLPQMYHSIINFITVPLPLKKKKKKKTCYMLLPVEQRAAVAQWIRLWTLNHEVAGSNMFSQLSCSWPWHCILIV